MAAYDDLNTGRIAVVSVISVVVVAVTVLGVQVLYFAMADAVDSRKQAQSDYRRQNRELESQLESVSRYGVDEATGNIVVPIDTVISEMAEASSRALPETDDQAARVIRFSPQS
ncbi:MAG: hypothetical protein AAGD07_18100 [Planctomycetota bacterium]